MRLKRSRAIDAQLETAAQTCARHGARLTELRGLVLRLALETEAPLTAYQLLDRLRATRKNAVPPTIYRALDFLMEQGLIHKVERLNAFIPCRESGHHDHPVQFLICRRCGTVAEIEDRAVSKALMHAAQRAGFRPDMATIELDGTCAACAHSA
jgi:Fur family transcriptional regulator, zinc uptake regulator